MTLNRLLLILFILLMPAMAETARYEIKVRKPRTEGFYNFNPFSLSHAVLSGVLQPLGLHNHLSGGDILSIIKAIRLHAAPENPLTISFPAYIKGSLVEIKVSVIRKDDRMLLYLLSNVDTETRQIIGRRESRKGKKPFAKGFFIYEDRLVNVKKLYSAERETELKTGLYINLVDLYIFDELVDNDEDALRILERAYKKEKVPIFRSGVLLSLLQLYLVREDYDEAELILADIEEFFAGPGRDLDPSILQLYQLTRQEYRLSLKLR